MIKFEYFCKIATLTALSSIFWIFGNEPVPKTGEVPIENIKDIDYLIGNSPNRFQLEFDKFDPKQGVKGKKWVFESEDQSLVNYIMAKIRFLM